jgi:hypothetical protein
MSAPDTLRVSCLLILEGVADSVADQCDSLLRGAVKVPDGVADLLLDAGAAFEAVLEADQVPVGVLILDLAQGGRDLFAFPVGDAVAFGVYAVIVGAV